MENSITAFLEDYQRIFSGDEISWIFKGTAGTYFQYFLILLYEKIWELVGESFACFSNFALLGKKGRDKRWRRGRESFAHSNLFFSWVLKNKTLKSFFWNIQSKHSCWKVLNERVHNTGFFHTQWVKRPPGPKDLKSKGPSFLGHKKVDLWKKVRNLGNC